MFFVLSQNFLLLEMEENGVVYQVWIPPTKTGLFCEYPNTYMEKILMQYQVLELFALS
jgi:hypothetical protein